MVKCGCSRESKEELKLRQRTAPGEMVKIKDDIDSRSKHGRRMLLEWIANNEPTMYTALMDVWPDIGKPIKLPRTILAKNVSAPSHECLHSPENVKTGMRSFSCTCVKEQLGLNCRTCKGPYAVESTCKRTCFVSILYPLSDLQTLRLRHRVR